MPFEETHCVEWLSCRAFFFSRHRNARNREIGRRSLQLKALPADTTAIVTARILYATHIPSYDENVVRSEVDIITITH